MKNRAVEFYRFAFSIIIVLYHYRSQISDAFLPSGYLCVEFFFLLSGFLMTAGLYKYMEEKESLNQFLPYVKRKVNHLYPHYLFSLIVFFIICVFVLKKLTIKEVVTQGFLNFIMLQMLGIKTVNGNAADWYVSALVIASFVLGFLMLKFKKVYLYCIAPALAAIIYIFLFYASGSLGTVRAFYGITFSGTLRAFAGLALGSVCFCLYHYLKNKYENCNRTTVLLTIVEICCLAATAYKFFKIGKSNVDFLMLPVFFIFIISVFLNGSIISKLLDNKVSAYLGKLSYSIYLNHTIIRDIFKKIHMDTLPKLILYLAIIIVWSVFTNWLIDKITSKWKVTDIPGIFLRKKQA